MTRAIRRAVWAVTAIGLSRNATGQPDRNASTPADISAPPRIGVTLDEGASGEWAITGIVPLSPAHRVGLRPGDLIIAVRGRPVSFDAPERFRDLMRQSPVLLTVERDGIQRVLLIPKRALNP